MRTVTPGIIRALNVHKANGAISGWSYSPDPVPDSGAVLPAG